MDPIILIQSICQQSSISSADLPLLRNFWGVISYLTRFIERELNLSDRQL
jgi:hypothetical protein